MSCVYFLVKIAQLHRRDTLIAEFNKYATPTTLVFEAISIYRYGMPPAFKRYFMPPAFNPDGVFPPWQVTPPATENMPVALFIHNSYTSTRLYGVIQLFL